MTLLAPMNTIRMPNEFHTEHLACHLLRGNGSAWQLDRLRIASLIDTEFVQPRTSEFDIGFRKGISDSGVTKQICRTDTRGNRQYSMANLAHDLL